MGGVVLMYDRQSLEPGVETPYKNLHGKEADVSLFKINDARAFVLNEAYTTRLGNWEGRLGGYSQESKVYRVYNPETRKVV